MESKLTKYFKNKIVLYQDFFYNDNNVDLVINYVIIRFIVNPENIGPT